MKKTIAFSILCISLSLYAADDKEPDAFLETGAAHIWMSEHGKQKVRDNTSGQIILNVKMDFFEQSGQNATLSRPKKIYLNKNDVIDIPTNFALKTAMLILSETTQAKIKKIETPRSIILVKKKDTSCSIQ